MFGVSPATAATGFAGTSVRTTCIMRTAGPAFESPPGPAGWHRRRSVEQRLRRFRGRPVARPNQICQTDAYRYRDRRKSRSCRRGTSNRPAEFPDISHARTPTTRDENTSGMTIIRRSRRNKSPIGSVKLKTAASTPRCEPPHIALTKTPAPAPTTKPRRMRLCSKSDFQ